MKRLKIPYSGRNEGFFSITEVGDFEYKNPIEQLCSVIVSHSADMNRDMLRLSMQSKPEMRACLNDPIMEQVVMNASLREAFKIWDNAYNDIISTTFPEQLLRILEDAPKKEQVKLLKGISLTGNELMAFIFEAYNKYGYTYSSYTTIHNPNGLDESQMPRFAYQENDDSLTKVGATNLSDNQIKQVINHRHVVVSKFLDKDKKWHCFFLTFKSIKGQENWNAGQPHLHFISHTWGLSRDYVLRQLRSKEYKLNNLPHIPFHTHRNPREDENSDLL